MFAEAVMRGNELKDRGRIWHETAEMKMIREEINALVDLPKYWELGARTVEKG